jgi:uncharacterized protein (DUF1697 family)
MQSRFIALLRGINVGGQKIIKMADLKRMFEAAGFHNVVTYIQSGNVVFDAPHPDADLLRREIETMLKSHLSYDVPTLVRRQADFHQTIARNPYHTITEGDVRKVSVTMLEGEPLAAAVASLPTASGTDELQVVGRDVYILHMAYGDTKLNNNFIEKKLGTWATTRNWATICKLAEL